MPTTPRRHDATTRVQRSGSVKEQQDFYLAWVHESVRMLRRAVTTAELDRLVLTRRYWFIQAAAATDSLIRVIGTEVDERQEQLKEALDDVQQQMQRWSRFSTFVVADTSFYLTHPDKIDELDFTHLLPNQWPHEEIHLLVPIIVLDELDRLKESGDQNRRWRASYTLAVLDRLLSDGRGPALLRREVKLSAPEKPEPVGAGDGSGARAQRRQKRLASSAVDNSTAPQSLDKSNVVSTEEEP